MLRWLRTVLLCVATLLPAITLFHRDEVGRWAANRCAMAAPDELSYLLMARNFATGHGASIQNVAHSETFYPPGFPAILALWSKAVDACGGNGLSIVSLHVCVSLLLCASVPLAYLVSRRVLVMYCDSSYAAWAAAAMALLYAANWYVLETALFLFSEPAFIVVTLLWLLLALRQPLWYESLGSVVLMAFLAVLATSIRAAGAVCLLTTIAYPLLAWWEHRTKVFPWKAPALGLLLAGTYFAGMHFLLPKSPDSYSSQLLFGITDHGLFTQAIRDHGPTPAILFQWVGHILHLMTTHFDDWAANFAPPYREDVPRTAIFILLSRILMLVGLAGWLGSLVDNKTPNRFPAVYVLLYVLLYALWPFDMTRFWVPIYPIMLAYGAVALRDYSRSGWRLGARGLAQVQRRVSMVAALLAGLLLIAFVEELVLVFPYYQRRLNYVSEVLAQTADYVQRHSPDGHPILVVAGGDEAKTMAWYMNVPPQPGLQGPRGIERQIEAQMRYLQDHPAAHLFVMSYFTHDLFREVFANLHEELPREIAAYEESPRTATSRPATGQWTIRQRLQIWNITAVWEFIPPGQ